MSAANGHPPPLPPVTPGVFRRPVAASLVLLAAGTGGSVAGFVNDPSRFAHAYLWAFTFAWTVVVGSLFFVALQHLTKSLWSVVIRRVAEAVASAAGVLALLALPVLVFAWMPQRFNLFPWTNQAVVDASAALQGKGAYLDVRFLTVRLLAFCALWWGFARFFVGRSLAQDRSTDPAGGSIVMRRWAPLFMLAFAGSVTFASFDLLMSLNPLWFSTIFGVYVFSGMFLAGLAAITLAVLRLRTMGLLGDDRVRGDHLYSLGALMFAMSCFWAYIAFSQYLLIWSGHLPDETTYYFRRTEGGWTLLTWALPVVRFVVPFLVLIGRPAKMNPRVLWPMAMVVLVGEAMDLYWMILPEAGDGGPWPSPFDLFPLALVTGAVGLVTARFVERHPVMAEGDPMLSRSMHFHL